MIKHFCNGCDEETPAADLTPVEATWAHPSGDGLGKRSSVTAELCPPCVTYLQRFLSEEETRAELKAVS